MSICRDLPTSSVGRSRTTLVARSGAAKGHWWRLTRWAVVVLLVLATVIAGGYEHALSGVARVGASSPAQAKDTDHLDPTLHSRIDRAIAAAGAAGVELRITSGWRSWTEQQHLFDAAVHKYGSPEAASHWVLPPDESAHVRGEAVDVGPRAGARWLEKHQVQFGLCRRYDNEWWHFEPLAPTDGGSCPPRAAHAGS